MGAERSFIYAKACGIIARSFVEGRLARCAGITTLEELYTLTGESSAKASSGFEQAFRAKNVREIFSVVKAFPKPPEFIIYLIKSYECADLKYALAAHRAGLPLPSQTPLGRFASICFSAYPDISRMLKGTEYQFLLKEDLERGDIADLETRIDRHYYAMLLAGLRRIQRRELPAFRYILNEEIALKNCVWALRLRTYFTMDSAAVRNYLIDEKPSPGSASLARDALKSLDFALDHRPDWLSWRRAGFLNQEQPNSYWKCSPSAFQSNAAVYLYHLTRKSFRRQPFSLDTAACFIRLKQFEEQVLCSIAEALRLNVPAQDALKMMGVPQ
ncbi:MAG: V-type ATPase subunit [Spirochaetaceae bacterium]|jgi:vacuolar-type H+-ATPase subunit C/Vma6|nr:V-type ATPase subunit [Spirochaetaceae bacterium]